GPATSARSSPRRRFATAPGPTSRSSTTNARRRRRAPWGPGPCPARPDGEHGGAARGAAVSLDRPGPLVGEGGALDLAHRVAGDGVDEDHRARALVGREPQARVLDQLLGRDPDARHDE